MGTRMEDVLAIVLGGGRGQRLFPLTKFRSKPAVPLGGRYRLVDIPISNCLNSGINRIFVLTQFNSASLNKHVVHTYKFDMFSGGFVDILAAEQTPDSSHWYQGTADAVRKSIKHFLPYGNTKYVVILSGDQLYQMDLRQIILSHIKKEADITVAAKPVAAVNASELGILKADKNGRVTAFAEKPASEKLAEIESENPDDPNRPYMANMGIYVFQRKFLVDLLTESKAVDFGKDLLPDAIAPYKVFSFPFDGYWEDVGTIRSFYEANLALTSSLPEFNFYNIQMPVYTHPRNLPGSKLNNCGVHQSVIASGCILNGADIRHSIIGVRSRIGAGTTVKRSIIMGADRYETFDQIKENKRNKVSNIGIGDHCTIINAIVDKDVRIGDNVSIINAHNLQQRDGDNYYIREGIIIIPKNSWIPNGTVI